LLEISSLSTHTSTGGEVTGTIAWSGSHRFGQEFHPAIVLRIPHSSYELRLKLAPGVDVAAMSAGKKVTGVIEGHAQRLHPAGAGGRFIEPVAGEPRIIAGTIHAAEASAQRLLVDAGAPIWLTTEQGQDFSILQPGRMVNGYVTTGTTFRPGLRDL